MERDDYNRKNMLSVLAAVLFSALLAAVAMFCGACGSERKDINTEQETKGEVWIYDPDYLELEIPGEITYITQMGDSLYYQTTERNEETGEVCGGLARISLGDGSVERLPLRIVGGQIFNYALREDGCVYVVGLFRDVEEQKGGRCLVKYDPAGEEVYRTELEGIMEREDTEYFNSMAVDSQGRSYLVNDKSRVFLFDEKGQFAGSLAPGDRGGIALAIGEGRDGKVYLSLAEDGYVLKEIDFDRKKTGASYKGFPGDCGGRLSYGVQKDFLLYDKTTVYDYDLAENTVEELFSWKDYSIDNSLVRFVGVLSDGRVMALLHDWTTEDYSVALMRKTSEAEAKPLKKETIVLATFSADPFLSKAVSNFNKQSKKYRIDIKEYYSQGQAMEDALEQLNTDIISEKCPDIMELDLFQEDSVEQMAGNGLFEDLTPYLEASGILKREDFVENILEGNTYGDVLAAIPRSFYVRALMIPAADAGEGMGIRLDEIYALADRHPGTALFRDPGSALYYCMYCNQEEFVDRDTGKCSFDSPEFIRLLEFSGQFYGRKTDREANTIELVQDGEVSVMDASFERFEKMQYYQELFGGEGVCVGYPTIDGSAAFPMQMSDRYAVSARSGKKDGAWEFLEIYLSMEQMKFEGGFPTLKERLEAAYEEACTISYAKGEDGEYFLDIYGDMIPELSYNASVTDGSGWTYVYRQTTKEEADLVREIIRQARPVRSHKAEIEKIISEEAGFFYNNAKSAEEVAAVIQRRVQLYVNENR